MMSNESDKTIKTKNNENNIVSLFVDEWKSCDKGRLITGCWISGLILGSIWGVYVRRKYKLIQRKYNNENNKKLLQLSSNVNLIENSRDVTPKNESDMKDLRSKNGLKGFYKILQLSFPGKISYPTVYSGLLIGSLVMKSKFVSRVNDSIGIMGELVVKKEWNSLAIATMNFSITTVYAAISLSLIEYFKNKLSNCLRYYLTMNMQNKYNIYGKDREELNVLEMIRKHSKQRSDPLRSVDDSLDDDVGNGSHLVKIKNEIINCDSIISKDCKEWCTLYSNCLGNFIKPIIEITIYSNKLANRIGIYYFSQCMLYFVVSSMWTRLVLPSIKTMKKDVTIYESNFINNHHRIIEYSEEIHMLNGIKTEINLLNNELNVINSKYNDIYYYNLIFSFYNNYLVRYLGILSSFMSLLPMISTNDKPTQFLLNNLHDLVNIGLAFRDLLKSTKDFQSLLGITTRINNYNNKLKLSLISGDNNNIFDDSNEIPTNEDELDDIKHDINVSTKPSVIQFKNVTIYTPQNDKQQPRLLLKNFNFDIRLGENVLIYGPNGAGKSSLLRVISGLWKQESGMIHISNILKESKYNIYYLPQRSYIIPNLSIKEQLLYPDINASNKHNKHISNNIIHELLKDAGFGRLLLLYNIESKQNILWNQLSGGEQQLILLLRVLIRKPKILFIDETINSLNSKKIEWFYNKCNEYNITIILISHNISLKSKHNILLNIKGDGYYQINKS